MAICGDGGFLMNAQELETAVRIGLDFVVLILCDRSYGMIKWKQEELGFPVWGLDFDNPDFVKFAEAHGAHGHRVNEVSELRPLLERCTQAKGVHVIDVPVDYSDTVCALAAARLSQRPES
jgi:acetolactate synthase-1/2/3 large subunit